jgi:hypothetical protein
MYVIYKYILGYFLRNGLVIYEHLVGALISISFW